ncbi:MAG: beta-propeller domain-containing protein [Thermoplasmatota archaeon]
MKEEIVSTCVLVMVVSSILIGGISIQDQDPRYSPDQMIIPRDEETDFQTFGSFNDFQSFIKEKDDLEGSYWTYKNLYSSSYYRDYIDSYADCCYCIADPSMGDARDYSTTNNQESGVDEGDVVKNDGDHAFIVSNDRKSVYILDVYPAEEMSIVSTIEMDDFSINEIYLSGDKLIVMGTRGNDYYYYDWYFYDHYEKPEILINVYRIEDRNTPTLLREDVIEGSYVTSRVIGEHYYVISRRYTGLIDNESDLPAPADEISYADIYDTSYIFTGITSININSITEPPNTRMMLIGKSSEVYVSLDNIYITHTKMISWVEEIEMKIDEVMVPILPDEVKIPIEETKDMDLSRSERIGRIDNIMGDYLDNLTRQEMDSFYDQWQGKEEEFNDRTNVNVERTAIHRISIYRGYINFRASGEVPGYILNRFSMGEYDDHFRIATTTGHVSRYDEGDARNHIYVLNMDLEIVGSIKDIAPGERIYSARFMGERAYLVTFDKVDPFFVIDLSNPYLPIILGELKIPGYSDYLHPYDDDHVIGLGLDTVLAEEGTFSWFQGVKLSLFDVTDVNNPKEISKYIIGDRGTYSLAQNDPHAFLFSLHRNLLVIPVELYELEVSKYQVSPNTYGEFAWEGAYVFDVTPENGFQLRGKITHSDDDRITGRRWWDEYGPTTIYRSFYIDDALYTVSYNMVKATSLSSLMEISKTDLPNSVEEDDYSYWYF